MRFACMLVDVHILHATWMDRIRVVISHWYQCSDPVSFVLFFLVEFQDWASPLSTACPWGPRPRCAMSVQTPYICQWQ